MPESQFQIHAVGIEHFGAIQAVLEAAHQNSSGLLGAQWNSDQLISEIQSGGWVLLLPGETSQMGAFLLFRNLPDATEITMLATSPRFQRRGLMRALFAHFLSTLPLGRAIWLEVHERNESAFQFYVGSGFQVTGRRTGYYSDGASAILLSKL